MAVISYLLVSMSGTVVFMFVVGGDSFVVLESRDAPHDPASMSVHVREAEGSDEDWDDVDYGAAGSHHGNTSWGKRRGWSRESGAGRPTAVSHGFSMYDQDEDSSEPEMVCCIL